MRAAGAVICLVIGLLGALSGCRTLKPDLKPPAEPEVCRTPPADRRYDSPDFPKQAMNNTPDWQKKRDPFDSSILQTRGGGMNPAQMSPTRPY